MNENVTLSFNLQNADGAPIDIMPANINIMLNPFYAIEEDIYGAFLSDGSKYLESIRKIIFDGSISIDSLIALNRLDTTSLSDSELFIIKRDYVICYGIYEFGKQFHLDYLQSTNKSKFLGDMKVSLEVKNDPTFIKMTLNDAKECMEAIAAMINSWTESIGLIQTFVKGELNPNSKVAYREWWHMNPLQRSPIAAAKYAPDGSTNRFKIGQVTSSMYGQFSNGG